MSNPKLLWHSNGPWTSTGYGQQTALFAPILAEHYDLAISAFYGLEGAPIRWHDIPVLPGLGGDFGNGTLPQHATRFFGGQKNGLVVTLCDVWPLDAEMAASVNMACWCPVDHDPAPPQVTDFFVASGAVPVAMSRFGERSLGLLDALYCPHAVDCEAFKPLNKKQVRRGRFPDGAFVVGMVAANKGHPSRKAFSQALLAFAKFAGQHDDAHLYLHTCLDPVIGQGVNIPALLRNLAIPLERVKVVDQYGLLYQPHPPGEMAQIYSALDVLLNPSLGEGFGIPILEAQACGVPAIVTDFSAMPEVCGAGWHVKHHPYWTGLASWQAVPDVDDIVRALEECYALGAVDRKALSLQARRHAVGYDVRKVAAEFMLPALRAAEQRYREAEPVTIPSRLQVAA